jgi:hypothetical protein
LITNRRACENPVCADIPKTDINNFLKGAKNVSSN